MKREYNFEPSRLKRSERLKQTVADFRSKQKLLANGEPLYYSTLAKLVGLTSQRVQWLCTKPDVLHPKSIERLEKALKKLGIELSTGEKICVSSADLVK